MKPLLHALAACAAFAGLAACGDQTVETTTPPAGDATAPYEPTTPPATIPPSTAPGATNPDGSTTNPDGSTTNPDGTTTPPPSSPPTTP